MKPYTYKFHLAPQILIQPPAGGGAIVLSTSGGQAPIFGAPSTGIMSQSTLTPSSNGIANFYDLAVAVPFQLADCQNYNLYTQLYDAYKLKKVSLKLEYLNNVSAVNTTGLMPTMYSYWDMDDVAIPTPLGINGRQGIKIQQFGDRSRTMVKTSARPAVTQSVATLAAGSTPAGIGKPQWLNCANPTVLHYGFKFVLTDLYLPVTGLIANQAFRFHWSYEVAFRTPIQTR